MTKLQFQDNVFLMTESGSEMHHIAGLYLLRKPANAGKNFVRDLIEPLQVEEVATSYRSKLKYAYPTPYQEWVEDPEFDLNFHLRHYGMPYPGTEAQLMALVNVLHSQRLDLHRPLWECHVIDGLEDNQFALFVKMHHAMVDGAGAMKLMEEFFSTSARSKKLLPPWLKKTAEPSKPAAQRRASNLFSRLEKAIIHSWQQSNDVGALGKIFAKQIAKGYFGRSDTGKTPFVAPRTIFNGNIGINREVHTANLPIKELRSLSTKTGTTINDIFLTVSSLAVKRYLEEMNELPNKSLIAVVPVSLKGSKEDMGNQLALAHCGLGTDMKEPQEQLTHISEEMQTEKAKYKRLKPSIARSYTNVAALPVIAVTMLHLASKFSPSFNFVVSNVKGHDKALYLRGAKLERFIPMSVLFNGQALNITGISYAGQLQIAMLVCPQSVPNASNLTRYVEEAFRDLKNTAKKKNNK